MQEPSLQAQCRRILRYLARPGDAQAIGTIGVTACRNAAGVTTMANSLALESARSTAESVLLVHVVSPRSMNQRSFPENTRKLTDVMQAADASTGRSAAVEQGKLTSAWATVSDHEGPPESEALPDLLAEAAERFAWIWVDLPPIKECERCPELLCGLEGVILVAEDEVTRKREIAAAAAVIRAGGATPLGMIVNKRRRLAPDWLLRLFDGA